MTTAVHKNEYFARELLGEQGFAIGNDQIAREKKFGTISLTPYVGTPANKAHILAERIIAAIEKKAAKEYPPSTILILGCVLNGVTEEGEWTEAVEQVLAAAVHRAFKEVFLIDTSSCAYSAVLH